MCVNDARAEKFLEGNESDGMYDMLAALQKNPEFANGELAAFKSRMWDAMCDYTHTGGLHAQRWNMDDAIEPDYSIEEVRCTVNSGHACLKPPAAVR